LKRHEARSEAAVDRRIFGLENEYGVENRSSEAMMRGQRGKFLPRAL
jgi:hypothetical protein